MSTERERTFIINGKPVTAIVKGVPVKKTVVRYQVSEPIEPFANVPLPIHPKADPIS
jgi:hypothetical protein